MTSQRGHLICCCKATVIWFGQQQLRQTQSKLSVTAVSSLYEIESPTLSIDDMSHKIDETSLQALRRRNPPRECHKKTGSYRESNTDTEDSTNDASSEYYTTDESDDDSENENDDSENEDDDSENEDDDRPDEDYGTSMDAGDIDSSEYSDDHLDSPLCDSDKEIVQRFINLQLTPHKSEK